MLYHNLVSVLSLPAYYKQRRNGSLVRALCSLFHCLNYPSPTVFSSLSTGRLGNLYFNIHYADCHYFYFECTCHKS